MITDPQVVQSQQLAILDNCEFSLSTELPSAWAQRRMHMTEGNFQGLLSHDITPYWTEILDRLSPYSGFEEVGLMGASQGGKTKAIIEPAICYYISEQPCNIGYISGNTELALESMIDLDKAIQNAGLHHLIRPATERVRNSRSGDTNKMKEYPGGNLIGGSATNHRTFRRRNWRFVIGDDIEEANNQSAKAGSTVQLIKKRTNSYGKSKKIFWCSTPLTVLGSIIYPIYLRGDQRKYHVPCQRCSTAISLEFEIQIDEKEKAGLTWAYDTNNKLKPGSVEYICQHCSQSFSEKNKYKFNKDGLWMPTATAESDVITTYQWNNLYSAPGMDNWETIVREYIAANPPGQPRKEAEHQTFWNLRLGLPFEPSGISPEASSITKNTRDYDIGTIPEKKSLADGNGRIIMLTCAADLNGTMKGFNSEINDARLDYEILAHTESRATYSIAHGSIGTFKPLGGNEGIDRVIWTYEHNAPNSVWPVFQKIIEQNFRTDGEKPRYMPIWITGLDCGVYATSGAYPFLDKTNSNVVGLKGKKEDQYVIFERDAALFKESSERPDMCILEVGIIKDKLSERMALKWDKSGDQPPYFMNYPHTGKYECPVKSEWHKKNGKEYEPEYLYTSENFFDHYQAEHRTTVKNNKGEMQFRWVKKNSAVQNHLFDCRVYGNVLPDIALYQFAKQFKVKDFTWQEFTQAVLNQIRIFES